MSVATGGDDSTVFHKDAGRFRYTLVWVPEGDHWRWKVSRAQASGVEQFARDLNKEGGTGTAPSRTLAEERGKDWLNRFIDRMDKDLRPIHNHLRVRIPANATARVEGGLWVGIAGSAVGEKTFLTAYGLACPVHRLHPVFDSPRISTGEWDVEVWACCAEFFDTVGEALVRIG